MDRLLRPDMAPGNSAQPEQAAPSPIRRTVDEGSCQRNFYLQKQHDAETYSNTREFSTKDFSGRTYDQLTPGTSLLAARSTSPLRSYDTPSARVSVALRDSHSHTVIPSSNFAGSRTFLENGKSQKSLDHKNKPMTIDDIRELLNKNK